MAFFKVLVMEPCPTTVSKVMGLYFLADTTKFSIFRVSLILQKYNFSALLRRRCNIFRVFAFCIKNHPIFVPMKMLVLVPKVTGRVMYVFDLMFKRLLGLDFEFTTDAEQFKSFDGPKLHYGHQRVGDEPFV